MQFHHTIGAAACASATCHRNPHHSVAHALCARGFPSFAPQQIANARARAHAHTHTHSHTLSIAPFTPTIPFLSSRQEEELTEAEKLFKAERGGGNYGAGTKEMQERNYIARKEAERRRRELFDDALTKFKKGTVEEVGAGGNGWCGGKVRTWCWNVGA